jgi:long-chain acyl-CoA synthetase
MAMSERPWERHYDFSVPTSIRYPRIPIADLLQIPANSYPDKAAIVFYGTEISFYDLRQIVLRMANALKNLGITKGDRVVIHLPNCPQYPMAYYAVLSLGGIVVNMNPLSTVHEMERVLKTTEPKAFVTYDGALPAIRQLSTQVPVPHIIVTAVMDFVEGRFRSTAESLALDKNWLHFSSLLEQSTDTRRCRVQIDPDDPALIQFTGGTTGNPKAAVITHGAVIAATLSVYLWGEAFLKNVPQQERSVVAIMPYYHVYGNIVVLNWSFWSCATQIQFVRFEINELLDTLEKFEKITFFPSVPTMISAIVNHPRVAELKLDKKLGLRNSGAAPMATELIETIKDMGIYFGEGWGMTETTSVGIGNPLLGMKKIGSIGIPSIGADVRLVDLQNGTTEVPRGEPGELIIKAPFLMKEYWNNPEETANQIRDGWLYTGDIAVRDEDDYFFIVDRKKDMIIASGFNIYPRDVDEVLYQHPAVQDAVTVGIPDAYRGETVKAFIVLREGSSVTEKDIIAFCRERLTAYKVPRLVEFRKELPKSVVGKVLRKILREEEMAKHEQEHKRG